MSSLLQPGPRSRTRIRKRRFVGYFAVAFVLAFVFWLRPTSAPSRLIFTGGPIITGGSIIADGSIISGALGSGLGQSGAASGQVGTGAGGQVEAVLIVDGRIQALGSLASVEAVADGAPIYNLEGNTLMPGLIEPHSHPLATAVLDAAVDVSGFRHASRAEVMISLKAGIAAGGNGGWVVAFGWDPVMIADLTAPTLAELDALSPDMPLIILTQMMHDAYANSAALAAAGISAGSPHPQGGMFMKDANGNLTGTVREVSAINRLMAVVPPAPGGAHALLLDQQYKKYAKAGYTTVATVGPVGGGPDPLGVLKRVAATSGMAVRSLIYALPSQISAEAVPESRTEAAPIIGVKYWMDGSPFAGGAAFADPYENTPLVKDRLHLPEGHIGALNHDAAAFRQTFEAYHKRGFQVATHVQGELAVDRVLDAVEAVLKAYPRADHRHRLEHNALITEAQLKRAARLGVTTSFFIDHLYFYGHALPALVGERTARYMPVKTALEAGHRVTVHTDNPSSPIGAFRAMQTLRQRSSQQGGHVIGADQRLSPEQALAAMTINAAWQLGIEQEAGSIELGKRADFLIVDRNPLTTSDAELQDIKVVATWLNGLPVDTRTVTPTSISLGVDMLWGMVFGD